MSWRRERPPVFRGGEKPWDRRGERYGDRQYDFKNRERENRLKVDKNIAKEQLLNGEEEGEVVLAPVDAPNDTNDRLNGARICENDRDDIESRDSRKTDYRPPSNLSRSPTQERTVSTNGSSHHYSTPSNSDTRNSYSKPHSDAHSSTPSTSSQTYASSKPSSSTNASLYNSNASYATNSSTSASNPSDANELVLPAWPPPPSEPQKKNWFAVYDPALDPKKSKGKEIIYRCSYAPQTLSPC